MKRLQRIHTTTISTDPVQILEHNVHRVKAILYLNYTPNSGYIQLGESGQEALNSGGIYLYYIPFTWYGSNPLWAVATGSSGGDVYLILTEIVEVP